MVQRRDCSGCSLLRKYSKAMKFKCRRVSRLSYLRSVRDKQTMSAAQRKACISADIIVIAIVICRSRADSATVLAASPVHWGEEVKRGPSSNVSLGNSSHRIWMN